MHPKGRDGDAGAVRRDFSGLAWIHIALIFGTHHLCSRTTVSRAFGQCIRLCVVDQAIIEKNKKRTWGVNIPNIPQPPECRRRLAEWSAVLAESGSVARIDGVSVVGLWVQSVAARC
jgi:hypothetical protein